MTEPALAGPRLLVPTDRQRDVGDEADYRDLTDQELPPEAPVAQRRSVRQVLLDLHPRALQGPKLALFVLCLTSLFARIDEQAMGVLLPQIRSEFGINLAFLGALSSFVGIFAVLANLPAGYLTDRIKRVRVVGTGTVLTGLSVVGQGFCPGVGSLVAVRLANGVAQGIAPPASFSLQTDWFPPSTRSRVFAYFFGAAQAGLILGPLVAGLLGELYGWRPTLIGLGSVATFAGLLVFLLREPPRGATELPPDEAAPEPLSFSQAYRAAASISTIRRCWYATPLLSVRGTFSILILPVFFAEVYQFSTFQIGLLVALNGLSGLIGLLIAGAIGDRVLADRPGRYMALMGGITALQAGMLVMLSYAPALPVAIAATQIAVVVETALQPAFYTLISLVVPVRLRGLGLATNAPWQVLGLLAVPFVVAVVDDIGLQRGVLVFVPALLLAAVILASGASGVARDIRARQAADRASRSSRSDDGGPTLLVCRDVDVEYDGVQVLFGVDLDVQQGEIVALVGTNGAGKSTMLRAIAGTQQASNGAIFLAGRDITHLPPHETAALGVVTMPGGAAVFPGLTVAENLRAAAWTLHGHPEEVELRTTEVLELFPVLADRLGQPAGSLSGGEQQMVGLSQALLMAPKLLMVDELSLGLAPRVVEQLLDVLRTLNARGTTIVIVEQSLNVALTIADRAVFMEKGEVRFSGPTEELLARPDLVRSVFMGGASGGTRTAARKRYVPDEVVTAALEVRDVTISFGGIQALQDVSVTVQPGQVVGVIGPNGAGKTTLFDVISGFVTPDAGTVLIAGGDVTSATPDTRARLGLGRSFQNARLFPALTVRENIAVALERRTVKSPVLGALWAPQVRTSERRIGKQVSRLVDLMGLAPYADNVLAELSTGTRRAVDVACIIALEPSVLLLDEPSSGLAQAETEALGPLLTRIVRETGCGMLVIEHDIPLVTSLSDELVAMESGRVLLSGPPDEVRNDPRVLASYLAASDDVVSRSGNRVSAVADALHPSKEQ